MTSEKLPKVEIYSDGGAAPNPGRGGYGVIMCCKGIRKEFSQGYELTTNNRMELSGVIAGLSKLKKKSDVTIYTDSQYTINGIKKGWAEKWKANSWYRVKNEKAVNHDLWAILLDLIGEHKVSFEWVKGHNGHEENERCDELATLAMDMNYLLIDEGYIPKEISMQESLDFSGEEKVNSTESGREDDLGYINKAEILRALGKGDKSVKINKEGDKCRKCGTPVVQKIPKHTKKTLLKEFYYEYYFSCLYCKTNYMTKDAKRDIKHLKL